MFNVKIAVVDHDPLARDFIANVMTYSVNRDVKTFESSEALKAYMQAGGHIDLVLSEVQLPGESGLHLLQFIKQEHPQMKFVTMSATPADEASASASGADAFLAKPVVLQDLFDIVKQFIVGK